MPSYNYECEKCNKIWDEIHSISERDAPTKLPCPYCKKKKCVRKSWEGCTPGLGADYTLTPDKATGGRWSELMKRMKSGAPKHLKGRLDQSNNMKGRRWK